MTTAENDDGLNPEVLDGEQENPDANEGNQGADDDTSEDGDSGDGSESEEGVVITIGDEESPASEGEDDPTASAPIRALRERNRALNAELKELRTKAASTPAPSQEVVVGPKPRLDSDEIQFDPEKFEVALEAWHERKRVADIETRKKQDEQAAAQKEWQGRLETYSKLKSELKVPDFDEAESVVDETLSQTQRGMIVHAADNSATLLYALGKNPKKCKELASINDPVKFAFAVAKLETQLKVTPRKSAPMPETTIRGNGRAPGNDAVLARLEAEADKTGDRTKIREYRAKLRAGAK